MTVVDLLARSPGRSEALALAGSGPSGNERLSFAELTSRVDVRAAELSGVHRAGSAVPLAVGADVDGIVDMLAHWRIGVVTALLNPGLTPAERTDATSRLAGARLPPTTQAVLWTSGTSGRPRGVAFSAENLHASGRAAKERLELTSSDVWLASLSPAHIGGLAIITRWLQLGCALVADGAFETARVNRCLGGLPGVTHASFVPVQLLRLLDHRGRMPAPATLKCVLIGGAHAPADLVDRALSAGWPIALTYGATEMSSQIATATPELVRRRPGTVGAPMPEVEVTVGVDGELFARGPSQALGYVASEPEVTLAGPDGWYATGDLGRVDAHGHVWLTGRRIDRIVSGGVTIDAVEVEEAIRLHPGVGDVCVVGVPDAEWGERVGAWVELAVRAPTAGAPNAEARDADRLDLDGPDVKTLEAFLRERLTGAKLPRVWHVGEGLPRNANGKVDRTAVRQALTTL